MPVLYVNLNKNSALSKEPYASFMKNYEIIKDSINGEKIELRVGGKDCFSNGFYIDRTYYKNPRLTIEFAEIASSSDIEKNCVFIRAAYSFEGEDNYDLEFHLGRVKEIKRRAPYYYIPDADNFEFSSQIDDEYRLYFDVLVSDRDKISKVCCSLIGLIISIFSLDN